MKAVEGIMRVAEPDVDVDAEALAVEEVLLALIEAVVNPEVVIVFVPETGTAVNWFEEEEPDVVEEVAFTGPELAGAELDAVEEEPPSVVS